MLAEWEMSVDERRKYLKCMARRYKAASKAGRGEYVCTLNGTDLATGWEAGRDGEPDGRARPADAEASTTYRRTGRASSYAILGSYLRR